MNTRFTLRVNGHPLELEKPSGSRMVNERHAVAIMTAGAQAPRHGDVVRHADVSLVEPVRAGATIDCTPNERKETTSGAYLSVGSMLDHGAVITDCSVTVEYASETRVVGTFQATARIGRPDEQNPLLQSIAGDFDVPLKTTEY